MYALYVEQLRACGEGSSVKVVAAKDDVIDVHLFGHAIQRGARWANVGWNTQPVECVNAIFSTDDKKIGGRESAAEDFRKSLADPLDAWRFGNIFEGNDEDDASGMERRLRKRLRKERDGREQDEEDSPQDKVIIAFVACLRFMCELSPFGRCTISEHEPRHAGQGSCYYRRDIWDRPGCC